MRIETISYLKKNAASLDVEEPLVITQNGQAVYRVESEQLAQQRDQGISLLKLMNIAERDIKNGRFSSVSDAKIRLRERIKQGSVSLNDPS